MTAGAYFFILSFGIRDIQRRMDRMAREAVGSCECYHGAVVLMALVTLRNAAVFFGMTGGTRLGGMLTDIGNQTGGHL